MEPAVIIALLSLVLLAVVWSIHRRLARSAAPPRPVQMESYPSITIVRPIRGLDVGAEQNIDAALDHGYPGQADVLFVLDDENEPAVPIIRQAIERRRQAGRPVQAEILFCGSPPPGRTGKLNAMIAATRRARGELIAFADSDIRPDPAALTALVHTLMTSPRAGAAFAPVVVTPPPVTMGDAGYALLLNALYGSVASAESQKQGGELPFIMGQFMVFSREAIAAIGGFESADGQLVDDMYLGARVRAAGLRNMMSPRSVPVIQHGLSMADFASVYRRWMTFSRSGLPGWSLKGTPMMLAIVFWAGLVAALGCGVAGWPLTALLAALAPASVALSLTRLNESYGGAPLRGRFAFAPWWLFLMAPVVFGTIYANRQVAWRGRTYSLDRTSRLAGGKARGADEPASSHRTVG